mmetsp:Transcript_5856/g.5704  ORF Transcript_5856/g.5704 Transcript_5856/m.5704 type:complete len:364 (+) Transcript_5856:1-1092(+)
MVRYNRVSTRNDSQDFGSQDIEDGVVVSDDHSCHNKKILLRTGSHSSASYMSTESNEENYFNEDEVLTQISTERSPLNDRNNAENDEISEVDSLASSGLIIPRSVSPKQITPIISAVYSSSFDLDDDDDDYVEAEMKRYHLDFSSRDRDISSSGNSNENLPPRTGSSNWFLLSAKYTWFSFQSVRQQARQRRAQLLLQQTERNWRQSLKICAATNCDATDSGILLVIALMVVWILILIFVKNPIVRQRSLFVGIILFGARVGTRPLYECFIRRRQKRRCQQLQEILQHSPSSRTRRCDVTIDNQHNHTFSKGNFELHTIRHNNSKSTSGGTNMLNMITSTSDDMQLEMQKSRSHESDPTVAAI